MCYSPRPNKDDLQAKYQYLSERGNIGTLSNPTRRALRLDRQREHFMNRMIAKHHNAEYQKVLDVGGGDGRLLRPFLEEGCRCYLVDFNPKPYLGIHRIGSTLEDIPSGSIFDILICSHVLEHVNDPGEFLSQLRSLLTNNGVVYIEVPLEIWRGIPINSDPVTHINFFTVNSLKNALLLNGLQPLSIKGKFSPYDGKYKRVAWAVASAAEIEPSLSSVSSIDTKKLIKPGLLPKLLRHVENFWLKKILNLPLTNHKN
ncbi:MAG: class I SAM-dependent methyltransferase [Segetibacter sp.]